MTDFPALVPQSVVPAAPAPQESDTPLTLVGILETPPNLYADLTRSISITGFLFADPSLDNAALQVQTAAGLLNIDPSPLQPNVTDSHAAQDVLSWAFANRKTVTVTLEPYGNALWATLEVPQPQPRSPTAPLFPPQAPPPTETTQPPQEAWPQGTSIEVLTVPFLNRQQSALGSETAPFHATETARADRLHTAPMPQPNERVPSPIDEDPHATLPEEAPAALASAPPHPRQSMAYATRAFALDATPHKTFRLETVLAPDAPPPRLKPGQILVKITHLPNTEMPVLESDQGDLFLLRVRPPLPAGTRLILEPKNFPAPNGASLASMKDGPKEQALERLAALFAQPLPDPMIARLQTHLSAHSETLSATLLFLFQALKNGDMGALFEGPGKLTSKEKEKLVATLREALAQPDVPAKDPVVGPWQEWRLPLFTGMAFQPLTLFVHPDNRDPEQRAAIGGAKQTRFLLTLAFSRLGDMQLDGLVCGKKLDLIVRSERGLPNDLPPTLQETWTQTLSALGLYGQLRFQTGRAQWITMQTAPRQEVLL